jgi:hypothetical protein
MTVPERHGEPTTQRVRYVFDIATLDEFTRSAAMTRALGQTLGD